MKYFTTFWQDFDIADVYGEEAICDTASRAFEEWKNDIEYLTELVMIINHKSWYYYERDNMDLCRVYTELYYEYYDKALSYIEKNGSKEDLRYFIQTLD